MNASIRSQKGKKDIGKKYLVQSFKSIIIKSIISVVIMLSLSQMIIAVGALARSIDLVSQYDISSGNGYAISYPPTISDGYIYLGNSHGELYKLNLSNISQVIATYNLNEEMTASLTISGQYLYVPCHDGYIYQLNSADLTPIANFSTGMTDNGEPELFNSRPTTYIDTDTGNIFMYIGNDNGKVYQLNGTNINQEIATYDAGNMVQSTPAAANGHVYVTNYDISGYGRLIELDASNISQEIANYTSTDDTSNVSSPILSEQYVYFWSGNTLYQLNTDINQEIAPGLQSFTYTIENQIGSSPIIYNGYVYLEGPYGYTYQSSGYIYQLNASDIRSTTGGLISLYQWQGTSPSNFQVTGGNVFVIGYDNTLINLNASEISQVLGRTTDQYDSNNLAALDNDVYIGGNNGTLYQLQIRCVENWIPNITECIDSNQTKEYIDLNNCGTINNLPIDNGTITECDTTPPVVSFCENYSDANFSDHPYNGEVYNENSYVSQMGCAYDTNLNTLYWSIYDIGYYVTSSAAEMSTFSNPIEGQPDVHFISNNVSALDMFGSDGQYTLTVEATDVNSNLGRETISVYYDPTPPYMYFCNDFGGLSPDDGAYLTNTSDFWMDLCVFDLTWNNMTAYFYDANNTIITQANGSWTGEDCTNAPCGFANQYYPLSDYALSDGIYNMQAIAADRANHTTYTEVRKFYYDTTPPIFIQSDIVDNSTMTSLTDNISFQFDERTVGSMFADLYYANGTYINQFPVMDCSYNSSVSGYNFIDDNGINCSINLLSMGVLPDGQYKISATYTDGVSLVGQSDAINFNMNCIENWVHRPLECAGTKELITYTDTHECGTTDSLPVDNGTIKDSGRCYYENNSIIYDCGNIVAPGIYSINGSISASDESSCIIIQSDNVTIDCSGYNIVGDVNGDEFTGLTLNNCNIDGSVTSTGANGGSEEYNGMPAGLVTITNSTVTSIASTGGGGWNTGSGGAGGTVIVYDSNITTITTAGGGGGWEGYGGIGGTVIVYDSNITTITTAGGAGYRHAGGYGGTVTAYDSDISTITTTGGNTPFGGLGGKGGAVDLYSSTADSITTTGEEEDGQVTIFNSNVQFDSAINIGAGHLILNQSYFSNNFGEIIFSYINTSQTNFSSIIIIGNDSAYVDSIDYPDYNVSANIMLNISDRNIVQPVIKKDGAICNDCYITNYDSGIISFDVSSWSTYIVTEADSSPSSSQGSSSGSGTGSSNGGGAQSISGGGSGGGGGGLALSCKENWKCDKWSSCSKLGAMARNCVDSNNCGTNTSKPATIQFCTPTGGALELGLLKKNSTALFDIILDVLQEPKEEGTNLTGKITLINFGSARNVTANITYTITDSQKSVVMQYTKSLHVFTQLEMIDTIDTSKLKKGAYTLTLALTYDGQEYPAETSVKFHVGNVDVFTRINEALSAADGTTRLLYGIGMMVIILLICIFGVKFARKIYSRKHGENLHFEDDVISENNISAAKENLSGDNKITGDESIIGNAQKAKSEKDKEDDKSRHSKQKSLKQ